MKTENLAKHFQIYFAIKRTLELLKIFAHVFYECKNSHLRNGAVGSVGRPSVESKDGVISAATKTTSKSTSMTVGAVQRIKYAG